MHQVKRRVVRVFISSTFKDMHAEREQLVKFTFPELRRRCRERQVDLVDVDLRWGITDEQKKVGKVLPICLAEINRCRPYFIGLLGERYGSVSENIDEELAEHEPWLKEHHRKSVTELEILHGVINHPAMAGRAFFYFRSPDYIQKIRPDIRSDFVPENLESHEKLKVLKNRIRKSGIPVHENYPDPKTVGDFIQRDLWHAIDKEFPAGSEPSFLDQEAIEHEAFSESRTRVYFGRSEYFERLDQHIECEGSPLVVKGESGIGKSALLANWAKRHIKEVPTDFTLTHYIGCGALSADPLLILRRIMSAMNRRYQLNREVPETPNKIMEEFPIWLTFVSLKSRMVLIIDGLNYLYSNMNAAELAWLPEYFPPKVRVIVAASPGNALEALEKRGWATLNVERMSIESKRTFIYDYLSIYGKSLDENRIKRITASDQSSTPLFLKVLLDELRVFGVHAELDKKIEYYLSCENVDLLYDKIFGRLEEDYEANIPGLVKKFLSLLWTSRNGLTESELLEIIESKGKPVPKYSWSPLFLALEEIQILINRVNLLNFANDYIRRAVENRYLVNDDEKVNFNIEISNYFEKRTIDERKIFELPWQLEKAGEIEKLKNVIVDPEVFINLATKSRRYELLRYWRALSNNFEIVTCYEEKIDFLLKSKASTHIIRNFLYQVAFLFELNSMNQAAGKFYLRALENWENAGETENPIFANILNNIAELYKEREEFNKAKELHLRALNIRTRTLGYDHADTANSLNNYGELLKRENNFKEAEIFLGKALSIREKIFRLNHPDTCNSINNLALLHLKKGDYKRAESLLNLALDSLKRIYLFENHFTAHVLSNLAAVYLSKSEHNKAENYFLKSLYIFEKLLGPYHNETSVCYENLAFLVIQKRDKKTAKNIAERLIKSCEYSENYDSIGTVKRLIVISEILCAINEDELSFRQLNRALEMAETKIKPYHPVKSMVLNNLGNLFLRHNDYISAAKRFKKAFEIRKNIFGDNHLSTFTSQTNLIGSLYLMKEHEEADNLLMKALKVLNHFKGDEFLYARQIINRLQFLRKNSLKGL
jgi:nephrocystin-3